LGGVRPRGTMVVLDNNSHPDQGNPVFPDLWNRGGDHGRCWLSKLQGIALQSRTQ
jgi:hypothetical protein